MAIFFIAKVSAILYYNCVETNDFMEISIAVFKSQMLRIRTVKQKAKYLNQRRVPAVFTF